MTTAVAGPLTPVARLIIDALEECGPLSRQELAALLGQSPGGIGTRLCGLAKEGKIVLAGDDMVGLPHQPLSPWMPDEERIRAQRRWLWRAHGVLTVALHEVDDGYLAQQLHALAVQLYGRRAAR
jgi:hypothetical protein